MTTKKTKKPAKTSKKAAEKQTKEEAPLSPEEQARRNELQTFVANNILNNLSLNQTVTIVQQIALRDAHTIISEADEAKLKEIETSFEAAKKAAQEQQAGMQMQMQPPAAEPVEDQPAEAETTTA